MRARRAVRTASLERTMSRRLFPALVVAALAAGCTDPVPVAPRDRSGPLFDHAADHCELAVTIPEALAVIEDLIAQVDALEADGSLGSGQARALRNHLVNARDALLRDQICAAVAQLGAFRDQVVSFVSDGVLTPEDAAPLLDAVRRLLGETPARITFQSVRDGNWEIYLINADGTGLTNLTQNPASDINPEWSPDGRKIAFLSERDGNWEIYLMNADGTGLVNVTRHPGGDFDPSWSPDGLQIAFTSLRDGLQSDVYVMNADGTGLRNLSMDPAVHDRHPAWSPSGSRIAYASLDVVAVNPDGTGLDNLTEHPTSCGYHGLVWSLDGGRIAFVACDIPADNGEVFVINADGTGQTNLSRHAAEDVAPTWSPDGLRIAFQSLRDGNRDIYVVNTDGAGMTNITRHPAFDGFPDWSRDSRIAFQSSRDGPGTFDIYVMNPDGSGLIRLTRHPAEDLGPRWKP